MTSPGRSTQPRQCRRIRTDVRTGGPSLGRPVRDTGIGVKPRNRRLRRRSAPAAPFMLVAAGLLLIGLLLGSLNSSGTDGATEATGTVAAVSGGTTEPQRDPTPVAAAYESLQIHLPIDPSAITMVAFHQASGLAALHLASSLEQIDAERLGEALREAAASGEATSGAWGGTCIQMWRSNRTGLPDTAIDVGTDPGAEVLSPVSGIVVSVVPYKLYNKYDDYEIHIRPDGYGDVECVLIHVDDVVVAAGDTVTAGITHIASVRKMSDKFELQLGGYTTNGGDHVHVQLNSITAADAGTANGS